MPRFETKLKDIADAGNSFGSDWQAWLTTVSAKWDGLKAKLEAIAIKIGTALLPVVSTLIDKFSALVDWVLKNKTWLGELAVAIMATAAAIKITTLAMSAFEAVAAIAASPIAMIALVLAGLAAGMIYAYNHSKAFHDVVVKAWTDIRAAATVVVAWFETTALPVIRDVWAKVVDGAKSAAQWYQANLAPTFAAFGDLLSAIFNRIAVVMSWLWEHVWHPILTTIVEYWQVVWMALQPILDVAWNLIKNAVETALSVLRAIFKLGTDLFKGDWSKVWDDVGGIFRAAWDGIVKGVQVAIGSLGGVFDGIKDAMLRGLADAASWLVDAGKWVIQGLINGIKGTANLIGSAIKSVADQITGTFKNLLGIHSPSAVFHGFGTNIAQGVINGVASMQSKVNARIGALVTVPALPAAATSSPNYGSSAYGAPTNGRSAAGAGASISVTVNEAVDATATANQVVRTLIARRV